MRRLAGEFASLLGVRRARPPARDSSAPRSSFRALLRAYEDERHDRVIERLASRTDFSSSRNPPGWRAEDVLGQGDGFLPLEDAARTLGLSETETLDACWRGFLEGEERGGFLYVRPAIVSVLGVAVTRGG